MPGQSEEWYQRVSKDVRAVEERSSVYSYKKSDLSPANRTDKIAREFAEFTQGKPKKIESVVSAKLLSLCLGDRALAERLVLAQISANPSRPQSWAVEKVIRDLERDRR